METFFFFVTGISFSSSADTRTAAAFHTDGHPGAGVVKSISRRCGKRTADGRAENTLARARFKYLLFVVCVCARSYIT